MVKTAKAIVLCLLAWPAVAFAVPAQRPTASDLYFSNLTPAQQRQVGEVAQQMQRMVAVNNAAEAAISRDLTALNLPELVSPVFRKRDADGALTRSRLASARALTDRGLRLRSQHDAAMFDLIARSSLTPPLKAHYRTALETLLTELGPQRRRLHALSLDTFDTIERCVARLAVVDWEERNGQYRFASSQDLAVFSQDIQHLEAMSQESVRIVADLQRRVAASAP